MISKSILFQDQKPKSPQIIYYPVSEYKKDHWALQFPKATDDNFIAIFKINGVLINVKLNSTDARGYRSIVTLVAEDMTSVLNRSYTPNEKRALQLMLGLVGEAFENAGCCIVQQQVAGNNSQSLTIDGKIQIGNEREPSMLHGHIIARGNPTNAYIANVLLKGPNPNILFNMRGDGFEEGNKAKLKWNLEEMNIVASIILEQLKLIITEFPHIEMVAEKKEKQNRLSI
jgi:hypothetical protein